MAEHRPAHVEQHMLCGDADHRLLHIAGAVVDEDGDGEGGGAPDEDAVIGDAAGHAAVDGGADDERDRELRRREDQHGDDRDDHLAAIGRDEAPDAADDLRIVDRAEDFLLLAMRADDGAGGTWRACDHGLFRTEAHSAAP